MARKHPEVNTLTPDGKMLCTKCEHWKVPEEFALAPRMTRGRHSWCRPCVAVYVKALNDARTPEERAEYNRKRRESGTNAAQARRYRALNPDSGKFSTIKYRYGISRSDYETLLEKQGGVCAVETCTAPVYAVDHDHSCCPGRRGCGRCVRGLLCHACNVAIGFAEDHADRLRAMADYLDAWSGQRLKDVLER